MNYLQTTTRNLASLLILLVYSIGSTIATAQQADSARSLTTISNIRPGVIHKRIVDERGPWVINLLEIDLTYRDLDIVSARAMDQLFGRERTSSIAKRFELKGTTVIAAINADFFSLRTGENENNQIADGLVVKGTKMTGSPFDTFDNIHSQFGMTWSRKPVLDRFEFSGSVSSKNGTRSELLGVNDFPKTNSVVLYNDMYGANTPTDTLHMGIREFTLEPLSARFDTITVVVIRTAKGGGMVIPHGSFVLSCYDLPTSHPLSNALLGDTLTLILGFTPGPPRLKTLVGGWPRIVLDGLNVGQIADSIEGTFPRFSAARHPRSGIGFTKDSTKVFFVVVDGRQQTSAGMTLTEFGNLMLSLRVFQGMNFDGGGSTTLVIDRGIVNSPSDATGERPIGNCLLLISRRE